MCKSQGHEGRCFLNSGEIIVRNDLLGNAPILKCFVEPVERETAFKIVEMLFDFEVLMQLTI